MKPRRSNQGFALLVAVIFTSVMLAFTLLVGALGYKQSVLANAARDSQYAFFAADAAMECLLLADSQRLFRYSKLVPPTEVPDIKCNCVSAEINGSQDYDDLRTPPRWVVTEFFNFPTTPATCAKVTIYKPPVGFGRTYFFSEGYSTACPGGVLPVNGRYTVRGLQSFK